jgi:GTP-sensing pleiotropic transcriptional regulator CodY
MCFSLNNTKLILILKSLLFWVVMQQAEVIATTCCIITHRSTVLGYFMAEARNHTYSCFILFCHLFWPCEICLKTFETKVLTSAD